MNDPQIQFIARKLIHWSAQERKHFGREELESLAQTIRRHGIIEPLGVVQENAEYRGLWGQRRWMAAELAGLDTVPAIVHEKPASEAETIEIRLIENVAREGLSALEQAAGLDGLMKTGGLNAAQAAQRVGMHSSVVSKLLSLLRLPDPIRNQIESGKITASQGYDLSRLEDAQKQSEFAEQVAAGALSGDALSGKIKSAKRSPERTRARSKFRVTAHLSGGRQVTLSGSGLHLDSVIAMLEETLTRCRAARGKGLGLSTILQVMADEARQHPPATTNHF